MNKKNNRKGFTIVELVIVIAVIALLATILVPTFGNVVEKAQNAALIAEIKNAHAKYVAEYIGTGDYSDTVYICFTENDARTYYLVDKGEIQLCSDDGLDVPMGTDNLSTVESVVVFCVECNRAFKTNLTENGQDEGNESGENNVNRYGDTHTHIGQES